MIRKYLYIFFILISVGFLNATTYYVDNVNGNDSNSGTSQDKPWRSISKVNSTQFSPGDQILFKRGGVWNEQLTISSSGTSSNYITYGSYSTGNRPKIDGNGAYTYNIYSSGKSYIKIMDFELEDIKSGGRNMYLRSGSNIIAENNYITLTQRAGIYIYLTSNSKLINNTIIVPSGSYPEQTDGIYSMDNNNNHYDRNYIIDGNEDPNPHSDCIQSYRDNSLIVSNGYFEQRNSKTSNAQGIYATTGAGTFYFYNNVVYAPNTKAQLICYINLDTGTGNLIAYNNTAKGGQMNVFRTDDPNAVVKNNIFITTGDMSMVRFDKPLNNPSTIDYNIYHSKSTSPVNYGGSVKSYTNWKSMGFEKNGYFVDPKLDAEYKPISTSPAIDNGVNLSSYLSKDKDGTSRPQGNGFDIGAYEYKSGTLPQDQTPPALQSISAINSTSVKLVFSEEISKTEAESVQSYSFNNSLVVKSAVLAGDQKTVTLQTSTINSGVNYTVTVTNVKDIAGNIISSNNNTGSFTYNYDQTPPTVQNAVALSINSVKLTFSEEVLKIDAESIQNYSVNNNLSVKSAVLSSDQKTVVLQTSDLISGYNYTITVNNVKDKAGNVLSSKNTASFSYTYDNVAPSLLSVTATSSRAVKLIFSEEVSSTEANDIQNYNINNNLSVKGAALQSDMKTVMLQTNRINSNTNYTITVNNIKDIAGSLIDPDKNSGTFSYASRQRKFRFKEASLTNGALLKSKSGALSDKVVYFTASESSAEINFDIDTADYYYAWARFYYEGNDSTNYMYLKLDNNHEVPFGSYNISNIWQWDGSGEDTIDSNLSKLSLDTLTVGSHSIKVRVNPTVSNFIYADVLILTNDSSYIPSDSDFTLTGTENKEDGFAPKHYSLDQNYPNPFNPSTTITYNLLQESMVELKVYDMLGKEVATLVKNTQSAGMHKVNFDAANLPSGIYIYQIKAENFIATKKMMLIK